MHEITPQIDDNKQNAATGRKRVHVLEHTITERYYFDPVALARQHGLVTNDQIIEFFQLHDGSMYVEDFFYNDANPEVGIELVERWDDE